MIGTPAAAGLPLVGLIPAAGSGVRAYPYTRAVPKSMLLVDGAPLIQRNVEMLRDQLGIRSIVIVTGHCGDVIRDHFGDGSRFGVGITYVHNDRLDLELPYSVYLASRAIEGSHCCMVLADECYIDSNHGELRAAVDRMALVTCALIASNNPKEIRKNYAVVVHDGTIAAMQEKPPATQGGLMGAGTYVLHPDALARLRAAYEAGPESGPRDWTTWLASFCAGGHVRPFLLRGAYVNVNSRDDLNYANYLLRSRTFGERLKSLIYILDEESDAAVRPVAEFAAQPEIDEVLVVARGEFPGLAAVMHHAKVRAVFSGAPDTPPGDLVRLGMDSAIGAVLVLSYSDDTFVPSDVAKLLVYLRDADMVVGTRTTRQMIEQSANMRGLIRTVHVLLAKLVELLWWRFEVRFTDICCVYRALWRSTYETVRGNLTSSGVEIFPELVIEVLRARKRIIEVPVNYYNRDWESPYVRSPYQRPDTLWRILRMILRKRFERRWWSVE